MFKRHRVDVAFDMIHGSQGFVLRESERLCVSQPNQKRSDESVAARGGTATARSVMIAVTNEFGVTSKAGLKTGTPSGTTRTPPICVTSAGSRCSIGILEPSGILRSSVERGAAT